MSARYTLYGIWLSGPAYKVGLMLNLAGEAFDYVHVNLRAGEHKQPDFLAKNRFGQVPVLIDHESGRKFCQSAAILDHLADVTGKFGGATLNERLEVREWMYWDFDRLAPKIYQSRGILIGLRQAPEGTLELLRQEGEAALSILDKHLQGRDWIVGEQPTIADIDLYGVVAYAGEGGFDLKNFAQVSHWKSKIEALPGFVAHDRLLPKETAKAAA